MIEKFLDPLLAPFRRLRSQWWGIRNIKSNIEGDVGRLKRMKDNAVGDARSAKAAVSSQVDSKKDPEAKK